MRFTVVIDPALIEEAKRVSGAKTKREAIEIALKEMIRRRRLKDAAAHAGRIEMALTLEDLERQRAEE